jgi:hypothetical protein
MKPFVFDQYFSTTNTASFFRWLFGVNKILQPLVSPLLPSASGAKFIDYSNLINTAEVIEKTLAKYPAWVIWLCGISMDYPTHISTEIKRYVREQRIAFDEALNTQEDFNFIQTISDLIKKQAVFTRAYPNLSKMSVLSKVDKKIQALKKEYKTLVDKYHGERNSQGWKDYVRQSIRESGRPPSSSSAEDAILQHNTKRNKLRHFRENLLHSRSYIELLSFNSCATLYYRWHHNLTQGEQFPQPLKSSYASLSQLVTRQMEYISSHRDCEISKIKQLDENINGKKKILSRNSANVLRHFSSYTEIKEATNIMQASISEIEALKKERTDLLISSNESLQQGFADSIGYQAFFGAECSTKKHAEYSLESLSI